MRVAQVVRMLPGQMARLQKDQSQASGVNYSLRATLRAELAEDRVDVKLDCVVTDVQVVGDGLVGESLREQP